MSKRKTNAFYIGWQENPPPEYRSRFLKVVTLLLCLVSLSAVILVVFQRGFAPSVFEFGKITTVEGVLVRNPVPMLRTVMPVSPDGPAVRHIVLVGFGKSGAEETLKKIETAEHLSLAGKAVRLAGTRISYHGKMALELTEGPGSFKGLVESLEQYEPVTQDFGDVRLVGEILDPKCALGAMKPGEGKPHRSCAVRCISGGVPPIFRIRTKQGVNYAFLLGEDGEPVNQQILPFVADQVRMCGRLRQIDDWLYFYTDPSDIFRLQPYWMNGRIPMCGGI